MDNQAQLQEQFSAHHDTGITRSINCWHRRYLEKAANQVARDHISEERQAYKESGIQSPAAAVYTLANTYKFAVYDRKETKAHNVIPNGGHLIGDVSPTFFSRFTTPEAE